MKIVSGVFLVPFLIFPLTAKAAFFDIEFIDEDGPHWTGTVNTELDVLEIVSWEEGAGGIDWWTPITPLIWVAVDGDGENYDVPNNWDGSLEGFGFLSLDTLTDMQWQQGSIDPGPGFGWRYVRPGWGIATTLPITGEEEFILGTGNNWLGFLPQNENPQGAARLLANSVSVQERGIQVAEPGTLPLVLIGLAGLALRRRQAIQVIKRIKTGCC